MQVTVVQLFFIVNKCYFYYFFLTDQLQIESYNSHICKYTLQHNVNS